LRCLLIPLCLVLASSYTYLVYARCRAKLWDWLNTLFATTISIVLGFAAGLWLYEIQVNRDDAARKIRLADELTVELNTTSGQLRNGPFVTGTQAGSADSILLADIRTITANEAISSGLFSDSTSKLILAVARNCSTYDKMLEFWMGILKAGDLNQVQRDDAVWASLQLASLRRDLLRGIEELETALAVGK
jgi:hypothetical protein